MTAEISAAGGVARGSAADATDPAALRAALAAAAAEIGAPSVLVWNVGRRVETPAPALDPSGPERDLRPTTVGAVAAAQAVTPAMAAAGDGTILVTDGGLALAPQYGGAVPALTAGKAAVRALVLAAAPEFAAQGVHLATVAIAGQVAPGGPFDPDRIAEAFWALHAERRDAWSVERVFYGS